MMMKKKVYFFIYLYLIFSYKDLEVIDIPAVLRSLDK